MNLAGGLLRRYTNTLGWVKRSQVSCLPLAGLPLPGVASGLCILCRLWHASDLCRRNSCPPPSIWQRTHALASCVAARRTRGKLSRTTHGESATCRFDVSGPRFQLVHAIDLPVNAFQRSGEHLLAPQGMFGRARKAPASRRLFPACLAALLARQSPFLVAHIAQPLAQRLEVIKTGIIDCGVVTAQDDLMLIVAENAAFEFAGYGHGSPLEIGAQLITSRLAKRGRPRPRRTRQT